MKGLRIAGLALALAVPAVPCAAAEAVKRWHKTIRAEFLTEHDYHHATIAELQAALDAWVAYYNTERPHQALGMRPPVERFRLAAPQPRRACAAARGPFRARSAPPPAHRRLRARPDSRTRHR